MENVRFVTDQGFRPISSGLRPDPVFGPPNGGQIAARAAWSARRSLTGPGLPPRTVPGYPYGASQRATPSALRPWLAPPGTCSGPTLPTTQTLPLGRKVGKRQRRTMLYLSGSIPKAGVILNEVDTAVCNFADS